MLERPILIIGLGNPLRSDDGVAAIACEQIDRLQWPAVSTMLAHQLLPETMLEMEGYKTVIILDAAREGEEPAWQKVEAGAPGSVTISHQFDAKMLSALQGIMQAERSEIFLCGIPGENFEHGERLSPKALLNLQRAIALVASRID